MNPNSKCNRVLNWKICGELFKNHENIQHNFVKRAANKYHIYRTGTIYVYCGWFEENVYNVAYEDQLQNIRSYALNNMLCTNCFRRFLFEMSRDTFMGVRNG